MKIAEHLCVNSVLPHVAVFLSHRVEVCICVEFGVASRCGLVPSVEARSFGQCVFLPHNADVRQIVCVEGLW